MNCQPSFAKATSAAFHGPLEDLGLLAGDPRTIEPDRETDERISCSLQARRANSADSGNGAITQEAGPESEPSRRRVPDCDIVYVGPLLRSAAAGEPVDVRDLACAPLNGAAPGVPATAAGRNTLRQSLIVLLALAVTALGGIYVGKRYAQSHVIVVPPPASERSVIT